MNTNSYNVPNDIKRMLVKQYFHLFSLKEHRARIQNATLEIITQQLEKLLGRNVDLINISQKMAVVLKPMNSNSVVLNILNCVSICHLQFASVMCDSRVTNV
jgi:hypothetical protein